MRNTVLIYSLVTVMISGCTYLTPPKAQPVIEDKVGEVGTLATTPERRVVVVNLTTGKFCAEPPADAADNLASTFSAAIKGDKAEVIEAKAEVATSMASNSKQLFFRSQGVQLYRDGMYSLCQAYVNGAISDANYTKYQFELLKTVSALIKAEIPELHRLQKDEITGPTLSLPVSTLVEQEEKNDSSKQENEKVIE